MKIGKKGFMMAEVVVVSVVIATVLVTLFTGLNKVSSAYETRNRYYDVDSLYAAIEINEILLRNVDSLDGKITKADKLENYISDNEELNDAIVAFDDFYSEEIMDTINYYITPYDRDELLTLKNLPYLSNTFLDYLDYLSGNLIFNDDYDYMIIVERFERENGSDDNRDDSYYYALKLKY